MTDAKLEARSFPEVGETPLAGRVAVITGASSGIGLATARALAASGARVGLAARRAARLEELAQELGWSGGEALALRSRRIALEGPCHLRRAFPSRLILSPLTEVKQQTERL